MCICVYMYIHIFIYFICVYICMAISTSKRTVSHLSRLTNELHDSCICDMTHLRVPWLNYVWRDSFVCAVTHVCVTRIVSHNVNHLRCDVTELYVMWRLHIYDVTQYTSLTCLGVHHLKYVCDVMHLRVTWLNCMWHHSCICDVTHSCIIDMSRRATSHLCVTRHIYVWRDWIVCDMTRAYVTWLIHASLTCLGAPAPIHM